MLKEVLEHHDARERAASREAKIEAAWLAENRA